MMRPLNDREKKNEQFMCATVLSTMGVVHV